MVFCMSWMNHRAEQCVIEASKEEPSLSNISIVQCLSFILDGIAEVLLSNMPRRRCQLDLLLAVKRI